MNLGLENKRALVTGGCKGIGRGIVDALENEGVKVYSVCRCKGYDLTQPGDVTKVLNLFGDMDILINNVGGGGTWQLKDWVIVHQKNIFPMVILTEGMITSMILKSWGRIINISSIFGKEAGGKPAFAMSKAAQVAFGKSYMDYFKLSGSNITINTVCPGPILVEGKEMKYDKYGMPEDVANLVTFLCSEKARWINGTSILVDGGMSRSF